MKKRCVYPWASMLIDNEYFKPCCNSGILLKAEPGMKLFDILNSPTFQNFRNSMLNGTSVEDGYCSPVCNYMVSGRASTESEIGQYLPEGLVTDSTVVFNPPEMVIFHADNQCNYDCLMCPERNIHDKYVANEDIVNLIYELDKNASSKFRLLWLGGEPFLKRSKDLLLEVNNNTKNCDFCLLTNGSIYDEEFMDKIRINNITLSIDSIKKETYEYIRQHGNLSNVLENLDKFISYRNKRGGFDIGIIVVVLYNNYKELPELIDFFSKYDNLDLTFQEGRLHHTHRFGIREKLSEMDIFYRCQTEFALKKDFIKTLQKAESMTEEIQKFKQPFLISESLNLMKLHVNNYQIIDHARTSKWTTL